MKYAWHKWLDMAKYDKAWHVQDLKEEYQEYKEAKGWRERWSELSDLVYCCGRARSRGYKIDFPLSRWKFFLGCLYMYPKYTSRFLFFRTAGRKLGAEIHEVRNPRKTHKLKDIAERYEVDPDNFVKICEDQLRFWPLLP